MKELEVHRASELLDHSSRCLESDRSAEPRRGNLSCKSLRKDFSGRESCPRAKVITPGSEPQTLSLTLASARWLVLCADSDSE